MTKSEPVTLVHYPKLGTGPCGLSHDTLLFHERGICYGCESSSDGARTDLDRLTAERGEVLTVTAIEYREYTLTCNGRGCSTFYGPHGVERSRANLRKLAARDGWTHVRSDLGRKHDEDFCPAHKPATESGS